MYLGPRLRKGLSLKRSSIAPTPPRLIVFLFSSSPRTSPSVPCVSLFLLSSSYFMRSLCFDCTEDGMLSFMSCDPLEDPFIPLMRILSSNDSVSLTLVKPSGHTSGTERKGDRWRGERGRHRLDRKVMNKLSRFATTCQRRNRFLGLAKLALC